MPVDFVLDASGGVAWLDGEEGHERMEQLLDRAGPNVSIHVVNFVEILYLYRRKSPAAALDASGRLLGTGLQVEHEILPELRDLVVELKATRTPISLADAFAVAYAMTNDAVLLTTDRGELEKLMDICKIEFLR